MTQPTVRRSRPGRDDPDNDHGQFRTEHAAADGRFTAVAHALPEQREFARLELRRYVLRLPDAALEFYPGETVGERRRALLTDLAGAALGEDIYGRALPGTKPASSWREVTGRETRGTTATPS